MIRRMISAAIAVAGLSLPVGAGMIDPQADPGPAPKVEAAQGQWYTVYYYNVRFPHRVHVYTSTTNYAQALRVAQFINSYPEYRAYVQ